MCRLGLFCISKPLHTHRFLFCRVNKAWAGYIVSAAEMPQRRRIVLVCVGGFDKKDQIRFICRVLKRAECPWYVWRNGFAADFMSMQNNHHRCLTRTSANYITENCRPGQTMGLQQKITTDTFVTTSYWISKCAWLYVNVQGHAGLVMTGRKGQGSASSFLQNCCFVFFKIQTEIICELYRPINVEFNKLTPDQRKLESILGIGGLT